MRALKAVLLLLVVVIPLSVAVSWRDQAVTRGEALVRDLAAAKARVIPRVPAPKAPLHDNGFKCLAGMLDVTPADLSPFYGRGMDVLNDFVDGTRPVSELSPEVSARLKALSPWATSVRSCGESASLGFVEGLAPGTPPQQLRWDRLTVATPALIEFTALELRVLLADKQPEVALERCAATWATVADQSHLGLLGATFARMAVRRLAPACGAALAAAAPDVRVQAGKQWMPLKNRLATAAEILEFERLNTSLLVFAWVAPEAERAQLPPVTPLGSTDLKNRLRVLHMWVDWDAAMRKLVAAGPEERASASAAVDASLGELKLSAQYAPFLASYEETGLVLDLLTDLASGGEHPLPTGVTKNEKQLEYVNAQGERLVIPLAQPQ